MNLKAICTCGCSDSILLLATMRQLPANEGPAYHSTLFVILLAIRWQLIPSQRNIEALSMSSKFRISPKQGKSNSFQQEPNWTTSPHCCHLVRPNVESGTLVCYPTCSTTSEHNVRSGGFYFMTGGLEIKHRPAWGMRNCVLTQKTTSALRNLSHVSELAQPRRPPILALTLTQGSVS